MLATYRQGGGGNQPPLLIAHGLFGSARNWGALAKRFAETREVISVDMRNHGDSAWADTHRYADLAGDLAEVIGAGRWDVLGHSMGGKAAMTLALTAPERVGRLVVADIAPVAYDHSHASYIAAMRAVPAKAMGRRRAADAALGTAIPDPGIRAFLLQSLDTQGARWRINLDVLEREMNHLTGWPVAHGSFDGPALFVAGGQSDYVTPDHRDAIKAHFPRATVLGIPRAGHWLHAERPEAFLTAVETWLARTSSAAGE